MSRRLQGRDFACLGACTVVAVLPGLLGCATQRLTEESRMFATPERTVAPPADDLLVSRGEPDDAMLHPERKLVSIVARDADLRSVLLTLAEQVDVDVVVDPGVDGTVTIEVRDVTFENALEAVLEPSDYHYRLTDGLLRVYDDAMQTRVFTVDYITGTRTGTTRLSASSGGTSSANGEQDGGSSSENLVSVDSRSTADVWQEIVSGLELIVFSNTDGHAEMVTGRSSADAFDGDAPEGAVPAGRSGASRGDESGPRLVVHPHSGTILVTASYRTLNRVADFLERIQGASYRQVVIEARIVEVTLTDDYTLGIDWSQVPGMGGVTSVFGQGDVAAAQTLAPSETVFQVAFSSGDFDALLGALANQGDVKVISAPRVAALNNQKAVFKAAREQSFFARRIDYETQPDGTSQPILTVEPQRVTIGLVLDCTPQISLEGDIMMNIHPSVTELVGEDVFPPGAEGDEVLANAPVLDIREVDTVVRVETGQLLVIGGLMKERVSEVRKMVPFLGKIPGLGYLFSQTKYVREHVELVIAMRPVVVVGQAAHEEAVAELERLERAY